jgi:hypothetical protein
MSIGSSVCLVTVAQAAPPPGAPEAQPESDAGAVRSGSGLFEQSLRDAAPASEAAPTPGTPAPSGLGIRLNGYARGDLFVGKAVGSGSGEVKAAYGELALRLQVDKESYGDAFAEVRLRSTPGAERPATVVDLREAYVNAYFGPLDLRVGHQIVVWGRADAFNPTNNLTPFDLRTRSPIEDDRRLANSAVRLWLNLAPLRLEAVWVPLYSAAELPAIEPGEFVALTEPNFPAPSLSNGLGALRVHLELPAIEASVSYLHGYAPLPGLALSDFTVGEDPPEVRIARTAYEQHVIGVDFSTAIGDLVALRGEAAYRHPVGYESKVYAPRPDLHYVVGVDRAFGPVSIILQYLGRYVFDWQVEPGPAAPVNPAVLAGLTPPLPPFVEQMITGSIEADLRMRNQILFSQRAEIQHLASLRAEWLTLHETLSISALGLFNANTEEWLLYPKLNYRISDWISATLGAEIYAGPENTLFGLIDEVQSAGYAELRASF